MIEVNMTRVNGVQYNGTPVSALNFDSKQIWPIESSPSDFTYAEQDGKVYVTDYIGDTTVPYITIPRVDTQGRKVTKLGPTTMDQSAKRFQFGGKIIVQDNIDEITGTAFAHSTMTDIVIGSGVKSLGYQAFTHCEQLTKIVIPDNVTYFGGFLLDNCNKLSSITMPYNITQPLMDTTFHQTAALKEFTIPDGWVTELKASFWGSGITKLVIGSGIKKILQDFTNYCFSLEDVSYRGTRAQFHELVKDSKGSWRGGPFKVVHCTDGDYDCNYMQYFSIDRVTTNYPYDGDYVTTKPYYNRYAVDMGYTRDGKVRLKQIFYTPDPADATNTGVKISVVASETQMVEFHQGATFDTPIVPFDQVQFTENGTPANFDLIIFGAFEVMEPQTLRLKLEGADGGGALRYLDIIAAYED